MSAGTVSRPATGSIERDGGSSLTGTGTLIRLMVRRDRLRIPAWIGGITLFTVASAASFPTTYPDPADRAAVAATMDLPATVAMLGPNYAGAQDYDYGAMLAHQMLVTTAVVVGLMSVLLIVRHTRTEEESGRAELVRATVVGRHAQVTAALSLAGIANLLLVGLLTAGLGASGIESVTWRGSLLFGAALAATGIVFAAVAAVTAQVTEHARGASGMAMAALGAAYAIRAVGDVGSGALTWASPIGWSQQARAYVDGRWWPLLLHVMVAAGLTGLAFALSVRRDVGAGLRRPRRGPAVASPALATPVGHALRLQRASLMGWCVALLMLGAMYGSILAGAEEMLADLEVMEQMLGDIAGGDIIDSFAGMITTVLAMIASIHAVLAVLRLRSEEGSGRAEPLLATALSRARWAGGHLTVAFLGGTVVILVGGLGLGVAGALVTADASLLGRILAATLVYVPAIWVTAGVAFALYGLLPRFASAAWVVVVGSFLVVYLGGFLQLPAWMADLSPFGHVPRLPAAEFEVMPLVWLLLLAVLLVIAGMAGLTRRDLRTPA